jgi:hypothetical protein
MKLSKVLNALQNVKMAMMVLVVLVTKNVLKDCMHAVHFVLNLSHNVSKVLRMLLN